MGYGVVQVQLYGYLLALLVAAIAATVGLVEVSEQSIPRLLGCRLTRQLYYAFENHLVGL